MTPKKITVIGSTGSIGTQALDIIKKRREEFELIALSAGNNFELFVEQIKLFNPKYVSINNESHSLKLKELFPKTIILKNIEEVAQIKDVDIVINAVVGIAGLASTLEALKHAKRVAIANKETLVSAPHLVREYQEKFKSELIPIDSEHVAIHQCISQYIESPTQELNSIVEKVLLTSSGGPFRTLPASEFTNITREQALKHPTWTMGPKITIDSATLMNKGLEVLEAQALFNIPLEKIQVVIHPQSIVHSAVSFIDGNTLAQLSLTDMRVAIQYAIDYPKKNLLQTEKNFDIFEIGKLEFEKPDLDKFPVLSLAYEAGYRSGSYPTVINSANEAAVALFLAGKISFLEISKTIEKAFSQHKKIAKPSLEIILAIDQEIKKSLELSYIYLGQN